MCGLVRMLGLGGSPTIADTTFFEEPGGATMPAHLLTAEPVSPSVTPRNSTGAATLSAMVLAAADRYEGTALRHYAAGSWQEISYSGLGVAAREIARGLIAVGIGPGDTVAILASTRPEWTLVDCGVLCAGATVVPIYFTNSAEECRYVLEHAEVKLVFCEDAAQVEKVHSLRDDLPHLEHIVSFDDSGDFSLAQLRERGSEVEVGAVNRIVAQTTPDDLATIVYTSGTTGPPKGCLLTHGNFMTTITMYEQRISFGDQVVIFFFLPLAHALARIIQMVALDMGATLAFWRGSTELLLEDVATTRPTHVPSVPRVFEKIHTKALAGVDEAGRLKQVLFHWALGTGRRVRERERTGATVGRALELQHRLADRLILSRVRDLFGGRLELALTGAAPIAHEVLEFFDACGIVVLEGYGMTETTAAATVNTAEEVRMGTVGRALPGSEIAIAPDGEILMRGPHIFAGYHKNEAATKETFTDEGWLRSGDLGGIDAEGYLSVTGRKKDLIITSSGKNISPAVLESALQESRWISQAVVYGDNKPYVVALVTLDPDEIPALAERCGCAPDPAVMAEDRGVRAVIQGDVDATNAQFARIEQIKRFTILDHEMTQEGGELTPTTKVRRNVVYDRYREDFERLYDER